jgi:thymidine phosphorylase
MAMYRVQFQMVDTFEVVVSAESVQEAKAQVRDNLEEGETYAENREFISWDTGTVRVIEAMDVVDFLESYLQKD